MTTAASSVLTPLSPSVLQPTTLLLAPGRGFGDGRHETTQLCLLAMGYLMRSRVKPWRMLDFGAGNGILGIAAARAGATVEAVEIDEGALTEAKRNAELNGVVAQFDFRRTMSDVKPHDFRKEPHDFRKEPHDFRKEPHDFRKEPHDFRKEPHDFRKEPHDFRKEPHDFRKEPHGFREKMSRGTDVFDLVVANILRAILLDYATELSLRVSRGGYLVLSGLTSTDVPSILASYRPLLPEHRAEVYERGQWRAVLFSPRRRPGSVAHSSLPPA